MEEQACATCPGGTSCYCCDGNTCNCAPDKGDPGCSVFSDGDAGDVEFCVATGTSPEDITSGCQSELGIPLGSLTHVTIFTGFGLLLAFSMFRWPLT